MNYWLIEALALRRVSEYEDALALLGMPRWHLTVHEALIARLEREYLASCQQVTFRRTNSERYWQVAYVMQWRPASKEHDFTENVIDMQRCHAWIALRVYGSAEYAFVVKSVLRRVTAVYRLRDLVGLDDEPDARLDLQTQVLDIAL